MSERVRGALFNMLGDIEGLTFLDGFAGSGALGIEAVSRGAKHVTSIDIDKNAGSIINKNIQDLDLAGRIKVVRANSGGWSDNNPDKRFDVVLLNPPFDDIKPQLLWKIAGHAKAGGVIVMSLPPAVEFAIPAKYELLTSKDYGDAQLKAYRKTA